MQHNMVLSTTKEIKNAFITFALVIGSRWEWFRADRRIKMAEATKSGQSRFNS